MVFKVLSFPRRSAIPPSSPSAPPRKRPARGRRLRFSAFEDPVAGARVAEGVLWTGWVREAPGSLGRCLRCHKLNSKAQSPASGFLSLVLAGSALGTHRSVNSDRAAPCAGFRALFPQARPPAAARPSVPRSVGAGARRRAGGRCCLRCSAAGAGGNESLGPFPWAAAGLPSW